MHIDHQVRVQHIRRQCHRCLQLVARQLDLSRPFNAASRGHNIHQTFSKHACPNVRQAEFSARDNGRHRFAVAIVIGQQEIDHFSVGDTDDASIQIDIPKFVLIYKKIEGGAGVA